jgi:hypothetical protein
MKDIAFADSDARGRNGWFKMAAASFYIGHDGRLNVSITSKRGVCPGPVFLELSVQGALTLARELVRGARLATRRRARIVAGRQSTAKQRRSAVSELRGGQS